MMTMADNFLASEMFGFRALSQFSIYCITYYHGGGLVIYVKDSAFKAEVKTGRSQGQGQEI